jgi:hypothetical protein
MVKGMTGHFFMNQFKLRNDAVAWVSGIYCTLQTKTTWIGYSISIKVQYLFSFFPFIKPHFSNPHKPTKHSIYRMASKWNI